MHIDLRTWSKIPTIKVMYMCQNLRYNEQESWIIRSTAIVRVQNASEMALSIVQREFPLYHPLIALARLAHRDDVIADPKLELEVHKTILPYVVPKLSSVEVKAEVKEERRVIVSLFEQTTLENGTIVDVEVPLVTDITDLVPLD